MPRLGLSLSLCDPWVRNPEVQSLMIRLDEEEPMLVGQSKPTPAPCGCSIHRPVVQTHSHLPAVECSSSRTPGPFCGHTHVLLPPGLFVSELPSGPFQAPEQPYVIHSPGPRVYVHPHSGGFTPIQKFTAQSSAHRRDLHSPFPFRADPEWGLFNGSCPFYVHSKIVSGPFHSQLERPEA